MITNFQSPNLQRKIIRKNKIIFFFRFSPILYQLAKFEAPSCNTFRNIMITNFQSPNLKSEIIRKKKKFFFLKFSPSNLFIILYQLTKLEAPSCNTFRNIMITNFQSPYLQREITLKNEITFFKKICTR